MLGSLLLDLDLLARLLTPQCVFFLSPLSTPHTHFLSLYVCHGMIPRFYSFSSSSLNWAQPTFPYRTHFTSG